MEDIKLSNEERARVFAMYWASPIVPLSEACTIAKKEGGYTDWGIRLVEKRYQISFGKNLFLIENYGLFLTPLSEITDEHAIEISKNFINNPYATNNKKLQISEGKEVSKNVCYGSSGFQIQYVFIYQYLIQKGYAVPLFFSLNHPANGKTAIDLGIVINKNKP